ncbi:trans-resveratrol di-O-methyltransferase [Gossypium raimondii]|uniref:O-methyltransferase domain-containing protein n=1 Tax=Gossypium raimondii TaxID=29730 RepID=A0A0D2VJI7_GOSRA|nr:trans-resveratrol di-O-methyltransferase [Gossypium raimondii]KJB84066.1 hypothetical protein B456_N001900 [Gossypium raimondii]
MDLIKGDEINLDELLEAQAHVWNHTFRFISSMSLKCAVELQIPDIIHNHGQAMNLSDLALALGIHHSKLHCLHRLMRILIHSGFFAESKTNPTDQQKAYVLTPVSHLLRKDNPLSSTPFILGMLDPVLLKPWQYLSSWFQNLDHPTAFSAAHGESMWDYAGHEPRMNHFFNDAMASDGLLAASVVLSKCKGVFEGFKSVVDVAGGTGTITKVLAKAFPQTEFTVFDLPHVVHGLQRCENLKYLGGDMFEGVPHGDMIMLKWILHDWSDQDCIKILERCKEAIGKKENGGKIVIMDIIIGNQELDEHQSTETKLFFDMEMMVCLDSQERSEQQWSKLFAHAGFSHYETYHILGLRCLIELFP